MKDKKNQVIPSVGNDKILGKCLVKILSESSDNKDSCPDIESIAAYIDGELDNDERRRIETHLVKCGNCYELLAETIKNQEEVAKPETRRINAWLYAAAGVLLVTVLWILAPKAIFQKKDDIKARMIADMLFKENQASVLLEAGKSESGTSYGFTGDISKKTACFRAGVHLVNYEIALKAKDKTILTDEARILSEFLEPLEESDKIVAFLRRVASNPSKANEEPDITIKIEMVLGSQDGRQMVQFGEWVQGGKMALSVGERDFFKQYPPRSFSKKLEGEGLPVGVFNELATLENSLDNNKENEALVKSLDTIRQLM